ncbi:MAG: putative phosphoserine phosphatase 2 [Chloroflexi bacterium ADurb.Bin360]|nr:MAG: putative phosphoserine phosphatase 2 [Chloroflexi bacterium ADurb.Bin360]
MFELTFLRHSESEGVQDNILQGHIDLPLTEKGRDQTRTLANYWLRNGQTFDSIITSPLKRARETSEIVASCLHISEVSEDLLWIERNFGMGEGVGLQIISEWYKLRPMPTVFEPVYETGETEWQVHMRAGKAIDQLVLHQEGNRLIVSHGNVINAALHMILGVLPAGRSLPIELALEPGCYAKVKYHSDTGRWSLASFNDHAFLNHATTTG